MVKNPRILVRRIEARRLLLTRMIHDGSSRNRAVAWRNGHAEPRDPEAYVNSTSRERVTSLPVEGLSKQRIRDCSRSAHESCGLRLGLASARTGGHRDTPS